MGMVEILQGDVVRLYDQDDWFREGEVIEVDSEFVLVDFADWLHKFPLRSIRELYLFYQRVLVATEAGVIVKRFGAQKA